MQSDTRRHLIALALLIAGGAWANLLWAGRAPEVTARPDFKAIPLQVAGLKGSVIPVEDRIFQYLGADAMEDFSYTNGQETVTLSLVYGTDWRAVHSPLSCLPQQGWQVNQRRMVELKTPAECPHPGPLNGQLLEASKPDGRHMLVLYVFAHKGGTTGDWVKQGWEVSKQPRGSGGLMLLLSMPVPGTDSRDAESLLVKVLDGVYCPAVAFWYRH
jgi:hypothetical protein